MSKIPDDIIDHLAGITSHPTLANIRQLRSVAREQAQKSFINLFDRSATENAGFNRQDRLLVAVFVAQLHREQGIADFYAQLLDSKVTDQLSVVLTQAQQSLTEGPYGRFPEGPLRHEDQEGIVYTPGADVVSVLGAALSAALAHAHLLVFHPRDANAQALQHLLDAGWRTPEVVTLSQLISFLSYQIRVVTGLRVLSRVSQPVAAS